MGIVESHRLYCLFVFFPTLFGIRFFWAWSGIYCLTHEPLQTDCAIVRCNCLKQSALSHFKNAVHQILSVWLHAVKHVAPKMFCNS